MNPDFTSYPNYSAQQNQPNWYNDFSNQSGFAQNYEQQIPQTPNNSQWVENPTFQTGISTLEEGTKMHGDKLKSEWQNRRDLEDSKDWREQRISSEGTKVHGDALLNNPHESKPEWKQSEIEYVNRSLDNLNLENKENTNLNTNWENKEQWKTTNWENLENKDSLNWENRGTKFDNWRDREVSKWNQKFYVPFTPLPSDETENWDKVDLLFSRGYAQDLDKLEEEERQFRIKNGRNYQYFGILQQINADILKRNASILPSISTATEVIKEKTSNWTEYTTDVLSHLSHDVMEKTKQIVDVAKDSLGYSDPSLLSSITKAEEKERLRRMNDKVDPMVDARRRRVEDELIHTVKLAN